MVPRGGAAAAPTGAATLETRARSPVPARPETGPNTVRAGRAAARPASEDDPALANIKSQKKRIRTNEKARLRNKSVKSALKTSVRKFREAAEAGDRETAAELLRTASRQLDKAHSKGVIHANQAANRKSAMAKKLTTIGS
jgi:small subunit ribosomal protein S20